MTINVLGVRFLNEKVDDVITMIDSGGLLVVPSAPGMASIATDTEYASAVQDADYAIADSGFMICCLRLLNRETPKRVSGLNLMRTLLKNKDFLTKREVLWILPTADMSVSITDTLLAHGARTENHTFEVAGVYPGRGEISDPKLLSKCAHKRYDWIIICIAGGKQEKLGAYLRRELKDGQTIACIGAAIAFQTGDQVKIPAWADFLFIGWLIRVLSAPSMYLPRYVYALKLFNHLRNENMGR